MFKRALVAATVRNRKQWRATTSLPVHSLGLSVIGTVKNDPGSALARLPKVSPNVLRLTREPTGSHYGRG